MFAPAIVIVPVIHAGQREPLRIAAEAALHERDRRQREADRHQHLSDVARVERPDQHDLGERREHAADDEPRRSSASTHCSSGDAPPASPLADQPA